MTFALYMLVLLVTLAAALLLSLHLEKDPGEAAWKRFNKPELEGSNVIQLPPPPVGRLDSASVSKALKGQKPDAVHEAKILRLRDRMEDK